MENGLESPPHPSTQSSPPPWELLLEPVRLLVNCARTDQVLAPGGGGGHSLEWRRRMMPPSPAACPGQSHCGRGSAAVPPHPPDCRVWVDPLSRLVHGNGSEHHLLFASPAV